MRQTSTGHSDVMLHPTQLVPFDFGINTCAVSSPNDLSVRHSFTPSDTHDKLETEDVEVFQGLEVTAESNHDFSAGEEGGDADGLLDRIFLDLDVKSLVFRYVARQISVGFSSFK